MTTHEDERPLHWILRFVRFVTLWMIVPSLFIALGMYVVGPRWDEWRGEPRKEVVVVPRTIEDLAAQPGSAPPPKSDSKPATAEPNVGRESAINVTIREITPGSGSSLEGPREDSSLSEPAQRERPRRRRSRRVRPRTPTTESARPPVSVEPPARGSQPDVQPPASIDAPATDE